MEQVFIYLQFLPRGHLQLLLNTSSKVRGNKMVAWKYVMILDEYF